MGSDILDACVSNNIRSDTCVFPFNMCIAWDALFSPAGVSMVLGAVMSVPRFVGILGKGILP